MADEINDSIPIQCVDDADGLPAVIVSDNETLYTYFQQENVSRQHGPYSSVRPFQHASYENEDTTMHREPPETDTSANEEDHMEKEEVEEEEAKLFILFLFLWLMTTIFQLM